VNNPIDKDKVAENPGLLAYPHTIGSVVVKPEDRGLIKSRALTAMQEQTDTMLKQIQMQVETLLYQAQEIRQRIEVSEKIYGAETRFEPVIGQVYHLYESGGIYKLMMIAPAQWNPEARGLNFISSVKLLSDHTWEVLK